MRLIVTNDPRVSDNQFKYIFSISHPIFFLVLKNISLFFSLYYRNVE